MSLQSRLFAFFVAIVVLPLAVASVLARGITVRELERRTAEQLRATGAAAAGGYQLRAVNSGPIQTRSIADGPDFHRLLLEGNYQELEIYIEQRLAEGEPTTRENSIDYVILTAPDGALLAQAFSEPDFLPGTTLPSAADIVQGNPLSRLVTRGSIPIQSGAEEDVVATIIGGYYLDNQFVGTIARATGVQATFFVDERAVSTSIDVALHSAEEVTLPLPDGVAFFEAEIAGEQVYAAPVMIAEDVPVGEVALVVSTPREPVAGLARRMTVGVALLMIFAALGAVVLGYLLTRGITRPLSELAAGADAIAGGDYEQHIETKSRDEVGKLAAAFNAMAGSLQNHITQLKESREELKRALTRFGETLRSTHDLEQLLNVIVDTSMDHLQAQRGLLMLLTPDRDRLIVRVYRGIDFAEFDLSVGQGLAGHVVEKGRPLRLPNGEEGVSAAPQEPKFRTTMMVPVFAEERAVGVLCLFDKEDGLNFTEVDMASLLSLADQAGVAIENVFLHDQARTHAIVDTVVGTWNRRYFHQRLDQELERHARFQREFSLLLVDIDDFKLVNDTYGHQRGDSVLIELVARVKKVIREIDVFARFGGEEFVLLLPETDGEGGLRTAERIRRAVMGASFEGEPPVEITVSLGVAAYPDHGRDQDELIAAADKAMYQAKSEGKNRSALYTTGEAGA